MLFMCVINQILITSAFAKTLFTNDMYALISAFCSASKSLLKLIPLLWIKPIIGSSSAITNAPHLIKGTLPKN